MRASSEALGNAGCVCFSSFAAGFLSAFIMPRCTVELQERAVKCEAAPILTCFYSPFPMEYVARLMSHPVHCGRCCVFSSSAVSGDPIWLSISYPCVSWENISPYVVH